MKAYYILGHNVAWLNGICLILFVIGVVGALAMVAIPEKFNLRVNKRRYIHILCAYGGGWVLRDVRYLHSLIFDG